ncbi:MAG: cation:proton antiporter [Rhodospirillaceae bacterium]|nr:cation:proton antiporter [Rhodospirillaceae bacterium]
MVMIVDIVLLTLLCCTGVAIMIVRHLFAVVALTGAFSLLSAGLLVTLDAVDVAFTEAAVGAGISTVLMLGTLALTRRREAKPPKLSPLGLGVVVLTGATLIYATPDMPKFGASDSPGLTHIVPTYIEGSEKDIAIPNIVTSILASYRGYDTLGEVAVIFTAGMGVIILLGRRREDEYGYSEETAAFPLRQGGDTEPDFGDDK